MRNLILTLCSLIKTTIEVYNGKYLKACIHAYILAENQIPDISIPGESTAQPPVPGGFLTWLVSTTEHGIVYWVLSPVIIAALTYVLYIKFRPSHGKDMYHIPLSRSDLHYHHYMYDTSVKHFVWMSVPKIKETGCSRSM